MENEFVEGRTKLVQKRVEVQKQIKALQEEMISNAKDAKWMKSQMAKLRVMQNRITHEPMELSVPCHEVKETLDFGACRISSTIRGYLFEAKGGMYTFVESRMNAVCEMLDTLFSLHKKADKNELEGEDKELYETFLDAVLYVFQAPIFSSIDQCSLFSNAASILKSWNDYAEEHYSNAEIKDDTEQDVKENIEFEKAAEGMGILIQNEKENPIGID